MFTSSFKVSAKWFVSTSSLLKECLFLAETISGIILNVPEVHFFKKNLKHQARIRNYLVRQVRYLSSPHQSQIPALFDSHLVLPLFILVMTMPLGHGRAVRPTQQFQLLWIRKQELRSGSPFLLTLWEFPGRFPASSLVIPSSFLP